MSYQVIARDAGNPPVSMKQPVTLLWTHPPRIDYKLIIDKVLRWTPLVEKFGTIVISRFDFDSEAALYESVRDAILAYTKEGDLVVDPFCGFSTTGVAALRHRRNFLGLDVSDAAINGSEARLCRL